MTDRNLSEVEGVLHAEASRLLSRNKDDVDISCPLSDLGMDSMDYVEMTIFIETQFNVSIRPEMLYEYNSIQEIASFILRESSFCVPV